ncbi:MAG: hypothetical protein JRI45_06640 [Deltaproteobacteria bacterium]|nr:hypothetical protein [Deltaproteobacteria bacterium]
MEPIISPWLIYLLGIVNGVKNFFTFFAALFGFLWIATIVGAAISHLDTDLTERYPTWRRAFLIASIAFLLTVIPAIFVPNRATLVGMIVAKNVTHDNVEKIVESGYSVKEEIKRDIIEIIEAIQEKETDKNSN